MTLHCPAFAPLKSPGLNCFHLFNPPFIRLHPLTWFWGSFIVECPLTVQIQEPPLSFLQLACLSDLFSSCSSGDMAPAQVPFPPLFSLLSLKLTSVKD